MEGQDRILSMWAFIALDADGTEGVVAANLDGVMHPLVGADLAMIDRLRPVAQLIATRTNRPITLVHFSTRTDHDVIHPSTT